MNLFGLWIDSYGKGLEAADRLAKAGAHILDCAVIGHYTQVLAHFESNEALSNFKYETSNYKEARAFKIPNLNSRIVDSYLSVSSPPIENFIIVVEGSYLGDIFKLAQRLDLEQVRISDLRLLRYQDPKVLLVLTGKNSELDPNLVIIENAISQAQLKIIYNVIQAPDAKIKELF